MPYYSWTEYDYNCTEQPSKATTTSKFNTSHTWFRIPGTGGQTALQPSIPEVWESSKLVDADNDVLSPD